MFASSPKSQDIDCKCPLRLYPGKAVMNRPDVGISNQRLTLSGMLFYKTEEPWNALEIKTVNLSHSVPFN